MASPFVIDLLPKSVRQGIPIIESGVSRGLSTNAITRTLRSGGIRTSSQSVGQAVRLLQRLQRREKAALGGTANRPINVNNLPVSLTNIKRNVSYNVELQFIHPKSNQLITKQLTVSTDQLDLTPNQIIEQAGDIINDLENYEGGEVISGRVTGAKKSPLFEAQ